MRMNIKAFALSAGILSAITLFIIALTASAFDWGVLTVELLADIYPGYRAGLAGGLIGALWGFVDFGVAAAAFAWLYNKISGNGTVVLKEEITVVTNS